MAKEFELYKNSISTNATQYLFEKGTELVLLNNDSKQPIRIDKVMCQMSGYHVATGAVIFGTVLSLTDAAGASWDATVSGTDVAGMETLLDKWKDLIWATDFRMVGSGVDEVMVPVWEFELATRRILMPGQKLVLNVYASNMTSEAAKTCHVFEDCNLWYSPAAQ